MGWEPGQKVHRSSSSKYKCLGDGWGGSEPSFWYSLESAVGCYTGISEHLGWSRVNQLVADTAKGTALSPVTFPWFVAPSGKKVI